MLAVLEDSLDRSTVISTVRSNCVLRRRTSLLALTLLALTLLAITLLAITLLALTLLALTLLAVTLLAFTLLAVTLLPVTLLAFTLLAFTLLAFTLLAFTLLAFTLLAVTLLAVTLLAVTLLAVTLLAITLLAITLLAITLLAFTLLAITLLAITLLAITLFRWRRLLWRRAQVNLERLPFCRRPVRLVGARVDGDRAILELAPRLSAKHLRHKRRRPAEGVPRPPHNQLVAQPDVATAKPGFEMHLRQPEVRIDGSYPHRHGRGRRHSKHFFIRHLNHDFRRQIRRDLDAVLELTEDLLLRRLAFGRPRTVHEAVRRKPGPATVGVELERERRLSARASGSPQRHANIPVTITPQIDGRRIERPVRLRNDGHPRSLDPSNVPLPRKRLALTVHVLGVVVSKLSDDECRGIDNGDANTLASAVARHNLKLHAVIQTAIGSGHNRGT